MAETDDSREKLRAYKRAWHQAHSAEQNARRRERRAANPDKLREDAARWRANIQPGHRAYQGHKDTAKRRGIPFLLTFEEWWDIWQASGKWEQRGLGSDQYCMARHGDAGAYEVDNVRICTGRENRIEQRKGKPLSEAHRKALVEAWKKRRARHRLPP